MPKSEGYRLWLGEVHELKSLVNSIEWHWWSTRSLSVLILQSVSCDLGQSAVCCDFEKAIEWGKAHVPDSFYGLAV